MAKLVGNDLSRLDSINGVTHVGNGDSIQSAINGVSNGGRIVIDPDYDPTVETLPIVVDKAVEIRGAGAFSESLIDFTGMGPYAFDIQAFPSTPFRSPTFQDLSIAGSGYKITSGNARWINCVVNFGGDGWYWPDDGNTKFNPALFNCYASNSDGNGTDSDGVGFRVAGKAHGLQLIGCIARGCDGKGVHTSTNPACVNIQGGNYERNGGYNIHIESFAATVANAYLERGRESGPSPKVGVRLEGEGNVVENCYHQAGSSTTSLEDFGVQIAGENCHVRNGVYTNHAAGFIDVGAGSLDSDIHAKTHHSAAGAALLNADDGSRTRSNGVIGGAGLSGKDLSALTGTTVGERAVANGLSAASAGALARWDGSAWQYHDPTGSV